MRASVAGSPGARQVFAYDSPIGPLTVRLRGGALSEIHFGADGGPGLPADHPVRAWLDAFFAGRPPGRVDFTLAATPFQRQVLEVTRSIPRGEVRTYGWVAARVGRPGAARAVGQALGANPLPLVIPCHRVVAAGPGGGYGGGLERKAFLLALERGAPGP
jgi:methylated-DNA-[protein]-cysteine S-methyltransferase